MELVEFLNALKRELEEVFCDINPESFKQEETWINVAGTQGWAKAFKSAAQKTGHLQILGFYEGLAWDDSDLFDLFIIDIACLHDIIEPR